MQAWEDGRVQRFFVGIVTAQNYTAARAAQGFVGGGGYEVAEWNRVRIFTAGNQTGIVCHVDKEVCADFIGDFAEFCPVDLQRVGRCAGHNHFRFVFESQAFYFGIIENFIFIQTISNGVVEFAGDVNACAVGQVAAVCQRHAQNGVARFQNRSVHGLVGLGAGVRLDIDIFCAKQLFSAVNRQLFNNINVFTATVVAFAGIAFSVFVGQLRTLGFHNGTADVVFRGDQLDVVLLALVFLGDGCCQIGVILCEGNAF